jgi:hypothetical protein
MSNVSVSPSASLAVAVNEYNEPTVALMRWAARNDLADGSPRCRTEAAPPVPGRR